MSISYYNTFAMFILYYNTFAMFISYYNTFAMFTLISSQLKLTFLKRNVIC